MANKEDIIKTYIKLNFKQPIKIGNYISETFWYNFKNFENSIPVSEEPICDNLNDEFCYDGSPTNYYRGFFTNDISKSVYKYIMKISNYDLSYFLKINNEFTFDKIIREVQTNNKLEISNIETKFYMIKLKEDKTNSYLYNFKTKDFDKFSNSDLKNKDFRINNLLQINSPYIYLIDYNRDDTFRNKYPYRNIDIFSNIMKDFDFNMSEIESFNVMSSNLNNIVEIQNNLNYPNNTNYIPYFSLFFSPVDFLDFYNKYDDNKNAYHYYNYSFSNSLSNVNKIEKLAYCIADYLYEIRLLGNYDFTMSNIPNSCVNKEILDNSNHLLYSFYIKQIKNITDTIMNCKDLPINKLIRTYYHKDNLRKEHLGILINLLIDSVVSIDMKNGVDTVKKYGITKNNITNIFFKV